MIKHFLAFEKQISDLENNQLKPLLDQKATNLTDSLNQEEKKKQLNDELVDLKKELKEAAKESQIYRIAIKIKVFGEFISGGKLEDDIEKYENFTQNNYYFFFFLYYFIF